MRDLTFSSVPSLEVKLGKEETYAETGEFVLQLAILGHEEVLEWFPSMLVRGISVRIWHSHEVGNGISGYLIEVHPCEFDVLSFHLVSKENWEEGRRGRTFMISNSRLISS